MDRNDELLLKLGWKYEPVRTEKGIHGPFTTYRWRQPDGVIFRGLPPRPRGSVDDALACVPEGWAPESMNWSRHVHAEVTRDPDDEIENVYCSLWNGQDGANYRFAPGSGNTPAEALSEAIAKAIGEEDQ